MIFNLTEIFYLMNFIQAEFSTSWLLTYSKWTLNWMTFIKLT